MNYLAHLYLAGEDKDLRIGGFLADFIKGPLNGKYPNQIELGMKLHRRIDFWSDQHAAIKSIRQLFPKEFSRYAGIIADVLGDHFLSLSWQNHSTQPLQYFAEQQTTLLTSQQEFFPDSAKKTLSRMKEGAWLTNYHRLPYCIGALGRIGQRITRENPLHLTAEPIEKNYEQLKLLCADILVDLKHDVAKWRAENMLTNN